ncbi:retron St85 family RNA-directed DNA polymerase [Methylovulum psychrotolerans]|uniref:retron St85 family RNA-directed DNA polymerase n=1 Tax=Methylovulum psychrotolerans TaxID=1704499 RepID=UPI001BFF48BD|nr:retron St85 family RNA-directed DNA polymerase [Methylovulum psychrotolerans]MBT9099076.1 retron St85 family RNA-directed DNA polymerase [Methylovulum psychrotolerans]
MQIYEFLCKELLVSKQEINEFVLSAPKKYKRYTIPKRTSGKRVIAQPAKRLKDYQRALIKLLEQILPVHDAAFAYKKNIGIKENARRHQKSSYLLKMDFRDFFYSITPDLFFAILKKLDIVFSPQDCYLLTQVLFFNPSKKTGGKLIMSIGAPSSPFISNSIMFFFDKAIYESCLKKGICYTRYADDLTFSSNKKNALFELPVLVKQLLVEHFCGCITINESKTVFSSKSHNRHVTGITITNDDRLSIGRQRKRYISSLIHKFSLNQLADEDINYLQGLLAFACHIEPNFKQRMIDKYSAETISQIVTCVRRGDEKA